MVVIWAWGIRAAWSHRCSSSGRSFSFCSTAAPILSRISAAAALVNVITSSWSISRGRSPSLIIRMIRSTSTAVLPLPAAADTRRFLFLLSITSCCLLVQFTAICFLVSFRFQFRPDFLRLKSLELAVSIACCLGIEPAHCMVGAIVAGRPVSLFVRL